MEIGENIAYLHEGRLGWQGSKEEVLKSGNELLHDFIFASPFLQKLKDSVDL
jgi:phospholipid/cholesterol/gamma-HCH transport system ATP-binding protein